MERGIFLSVNEKVIHSSVDKPQALPQFVKNGGCSG